MRERKKGRAYVGHCSKTYWYLVASKSYLVSCLMGTSSQVLFRKAAGVEQKGGLRSFCCGGSEHGLIAQMARALNYKQR